MTEYKGFLLQNYKRSPVEFVRGEGAILFDAYGREYLDFCSGIAVTPFGHNHEVIKAAVQNQLNNVWHTSNLFSNSLQETVAEKLVKRSHLSKVFFCNSGTEANEAALKFARKSRKGRHKILAAHGSFHGRTFGSLSVTGNEKYWSGFEPLLPGVDFFEFGNIDQLTGIISEEYAAIILEPIQGENGVIVAENDFLRNVRELCSTYGVLLIMDEVQSGIGRTGRFYAHEYSGIRPDIITLAKGLANGLPIGAVIVSEEIASVMIPGTHGSTFGGNSIALAAANAVLDLCTDSVLQCNFETGEVLKNILLEKLQQFNPEYRGRGLMIGIQLPERFPASEISGKLLSLCLLTVTAGNNTIRFLPPYILSSDDISNLSVIISSELL